MDRKLDSYARVFKDAIPKTVRETTVEFLSIADWSGHSFTNHKDGSITSYDDDLEVSHDSSPKHNELMKLVWDTIHRYVTDNQMPWYSGWAGYSSIRYNRYQKGSTMHQHADHITSMFDGQRKGIPTLSIVGLLNDDFTGGEFMMWDKPAKNLKLKAGDILVFPSNFLYPHTVQHVTKGTRYSFVSWVW
jgi:predicted 2-oxoglutarate/Fe(II)-dependent dioxygenase YbiX